MENRTRSYHNLTLKTLGRFYMPPPLESSSSVDVGSIVSHWRETWVPSVLQAVLHLYCAWAWIKCQTRQPSSSLRRWELLAVLLVLREKQGGFPPRSRLLPFALFLFSLSFVFLLTIALFFDHFIQCILTIYPLKLLVYTLYTLNSRPVLGFLTSAYPCPFVRILSPNYTWECGLLWSVVTLPESHHWRKLSSPLPEATKCQSFFSWWYNSMQLPPMLGFYLV